MRSPSSAERFCVLFAVLATLVSAPAFADLVFTSEPPTTATVGQPYSYTMTAADVPDDEEDDDGIDIDIDLDGRIRFIARALPPWLEFDGNDTIFGTPGPDDVGRHRVRLRARSGRDSADQEFFITVAAASGPPPQGADLAASVSVAPNPVTVGDAAAWSVTVRNNSDTDVANAVLETVFSGDATFRIEDVDDESCAIEPRGENTAVTCRWSPLAGGASRSADVVGSASSAGDISATATASIADSSPTDPNPDNNEARIVLSVTEAQGQAPAQELAAPGAAAVAVADFDGDARDDVAVATGAGEPTLVFLNDPDGGASSPLTATPISAGDDALAGTGIAAGDLDGDGFVDIVIANADGPNQILFNNGSASLEATTLDGPADASAGGSRDVAIADVDGDSLPDIVFANDGAGSVYRNLGGRSFAAENVDARSSAAVTAADLLGDGNPEIVFANSDRNAEVHGRSDGSWSSLATLETGPAAAVAAADVDADGDADLAFGRAAADLVLSNASASSPAFSVADQLGESATAAVLMEDFDGDGRNDVASIGASGAHRLYSNDGAAEPTFSARSAGFSGRAAADAAAGLFDDGNALDVAVVGSDVLAVFLNIGGPDSGGGSRGAPTLTVNGESTVILTVGDTYEDAGATASDDVDGDLTEQILVDNPVDTSLIGRYSVTYEVVDSDGNLATATRTVEVQARTPTGGGGGGAAGVALLLLGVCGIAARRNKARRA
ncbi:MAG: VCBS repeat-containing protein, partial [Gammaproteobacteria bacterium]|nr:VCBS repeat-containing protein [Gammaproteobacteria bacterium]